MNKKIKVLFIGHEASLSGAPLLLLNILNVVKHDSEIGIRIVLKRGGVLVNQFKDIGPTIQIKSDNYRKNTNFLYQLFDIIFSKFNFLKAAYWSLKANVIFNNTITNGRILHQLSKFKTPVITYVHELKDVAKIFEKENDTIYTIHHTDLFCCPSNVVSLFLTEEYKVPENKKIIFPYYFPFDQYRHLITDENKINLKNSYAEKYSIDANTIWIVCMGKICYRKGYDIFIRIAEICHQKNPGKFSFIWIGDAENKVIEDELQQVGLQLKEHNIHFIGMMPHSYDSLLPFDIFLLSSREDPYPLVVLEAAFQKVPTICFKEAGGIKEFVGDDAGWCMPDFSEIKVVEKLDEVSLFLPMIAKKAEAAHLKVLQLHGNESKTKELFYTILKDQTTI